ncbi:ribonuclease HII [candidate division WWE3 bacterium]|nr:ribonuclease HII [candidate division WWE3 bacterium]
MTDYFFCERNLLENGIDYIAGVDEVGRGALAGPLVAAAVILNPRHLRFNDISEAYGQIKDSKQLSPKKRGLLDKFITENAISYSIQAIENTKIDEWGMTKSTQISFYNCVKSLGVAPGHILTDAFPINAINREKQTNIKNGDELSISIAAASIIAKVYRDNLMINFHRQFEKYGFDVHKGYGTRKHIEAIMQHGPCDIHRMSFKPIRAILNP